METRKNNGCSLSIWLLFFVAAAIGLGSNAAQGVSYLDDFESGYRDGVELQWHLGWYQNAVSPMTAPDDDGSGRFRLSIGSESFVWLAQPFSWSDLSVDDSVTIGMDFESNSTGDKFNDDRVGWNIKDDDTASDHILGVQFDTSSNRIEGYWDGRITADRRPLITSSWGGTHPKANTWYRLRAKFTKKGDKRILINVTVDEVNVNGGIVTPNVATGSLDTDTLADADKPHDKYFEGDKIWPTFKNFSGSSDGLADNAYFHIDDGIDDVAVVEVTDDSASESGATAEFRVKLSSQPSPSSSVTVTAYPGYNGYDIDLGSGAGKPVSLAFSDGNYDTWQYVTVQADNDDVHESPGTEIGAISFGITSSDPSFDGCYANPSVIRFNITDNDTDVLNAGPYLLYTDVNTQMRVLWQTKSAQTGMLTWGTTTACVDDSQIVSTSAGEYRYSHIIGTGDDTALNPGTRYYYRLSVGGATYHGSFYSAPASSVEEVKFLAYGDTRGDGSAPAYGHAGVCEGIVDTLAIDPAYQTFALHVGDWVNDGTSQSDWQNQWFNRSFPSVRSLFANLPFQGVMGNHEGSGTVTASWFKKYYPYNYRAGSSDKWYYFYYGPIHVVVINEYRHESWEDSRPDYLTLTERNAVKANLSGSPKNWKVIVIHAPGYSAGVGHRNHVYSQAHIQDIADTCGVQLVFAGHNHYYARCDKNGVKHLTVGCGGAPYHTPNPTYTPEVEFAKKSRSFSEIYVRDNVLRLRTRNREGTIIDRFTLLYPGTADHYYVNGSTGNDSWDGLAPEYVSGTNGPKATISSAISASTNGDLVEVAEGTYTESIDFDGKSIVVTSADPEDPETVDNTIIYFDAGESGDAVVNFTSSEGSDSILTGFTIKSDGTYYYHGVICDGASPTIRDCIVENTHDGIRCLNGSEANIRNCTFRDSYVYGWGVYCYYSDADIQDNIFYNNWQGVVCDYSSADIRNNIMYDNDYGVECFYDVGTKVIGNTIVHSTYCGVWSLSTPGPEVTNCILWNPNPYQGDLYNSSATFSCLYDDDTGDGNIHPPDPLFVNADENDFRLADDSPCIDAGDPTYSPLPGETDIHGEPRVQEGRVDIGADETSKNGHLYVDPDGGSDGRSWDSPMDSIQEAIDAASDGDIIDVNEGTYYGPIDFKGKKITIRSLNPLDPDVVANTIIDANADSSEPNRAVTFNSGEGSFSVLDGFTVTGGYAPGIGIDRDGAGIFCYQSSPIIRNCVVTGHYSGDDGGGIFLDDDSDAEITGCTISSNESGDKGGGMYCRGSSPSLSDCTFNDNDSGTDGGGFYCTASTPTVTNCVFMGNDSTADGGGFYSMTSTPTVANCAFIGNHSGDDGGGFYSQDNSPTVRNCIAAHNTATDKGGGFYSRDNTPGITNCTIYGNSAVRGGGIYQSRSDAVVTNCILWDDTASDTGNEVYNSESTPVITYCDVEGGWTGTGNINSNPSLANPANDDYHLGSSSPCIDTGYSGGTYTGQVDVDGEPRVMDIAGKGDGTVDVDMGADEVAGKVHNVTNDIRYFSIQTAINSASNDDVIEVKEGTYYEAIDFDGKSITLTSTDPEDSDVVAATIIDSYGANYAVTLNSGEGEDSVLTGFTLKGNYGGAYCSDTSPTISNCIVTNANYYGIACFGYTATPTITNCHVDNSTYYGILLYCTGGTVRNCITENCAYGIYAYCNDSPLTIENNYIRGNGRGIYVYYTYSSTPYIRNNWIYDNSTAGIETYSSNYPGVFTNNTIVGNYYGIRVSSGTAPTVRNCIIWGSYDDLYNCSATYSCIEDGDYGTGNISGNPLFVDAQNDDYHLGSSSPCIDIGYSSESYTGQLDIDFEDRVIDVPGEGDGTVDVDMGADEYNPDL